MAIQIKVPAVGESISEVTIANWLKKDGDSVKLDEVIAELESDKATFELTAQSDGILKIIKQQGETVPIGETICEIESGAQATPAAQPPKEAAQTPAAKSEPPAKAEVKSSGGIKEMKVPAVGESITEVTISTWLKKDGDLVKLDEVIAEVESDKATFELPAEATGILRIVAKEKETLPIGGLICKIEITDAATVGATSGAKQPAMTAAAGGEDKSYAAGHPSPAAAKILSEKGIQPGQVQGNGVGGRITKEDAVKAQAGATATPAEAKHQPSQTPPAISPGGSRNIRKEKMTSLRRTIAKRLVS